MILGLLDTGARAQEFLDLNLEDIDSGTGSVLIRQRKGRNPCMVFLGRITFRVFRSYFKSRHDTYPALWISIHYEGMTCGALRYVLRRRAQMAGIKDILTPHDFRRASALVMLRNGVDIFALQKLMGHSDLQVLRRFLAQTNWDIHTAICESARGQQLINTQSEKTRHYFPNLLDIPRTIPQLGRSDSTRDARLSI